MQASFTPEGTLVLTNPSQSTAFTAKKGMSGIYPTSYFTNVSPGSKFVSADGKWLDMPQAALWGASAQGSNQSVVLLSLGSPTYNADAKVCTSAAFKLPAFSLGRGALDFAMRSVQLIKHMHCSCDA